MAIEYTELNVEQQDAQLRQRILGWEADHFGHEINKQAFLGLPESDEGRTVGIKKAEESQLILESSIKAARAQREKIKAARPATPAPANPPAGQA